MEAWLDRAIEKGVQQGIQQGQLEACYRLYIIRKIGADVAAKTCGLENAEAFLAACRAKGWKI